MNEQDVFLLAEAALRRVVEQIRDEQWGMTMPPAFAMSDQSRTATLREVITYHAYDLAWVPDMLAGRTMDEVGQDAFKGDLLGDDPQGNFARIGDAARAAVRELDDPERMVHCSYGDLPAREYLMHINGFHGLRAHDLAEVIGVESALPDDLVQGLWDEIAPHAEEWRAIGVFGPKVEVAEDAPLQDRLLGLTGRQP